MRTIPWGTALIKYGKHRTLKEQEATMARSTKATMGEKDLYCTLELHIRPDTRIAASVLETLSQTPLISIGGLGREAHLYFMADNGGTAFDTLDKFVTFLADYRDSLRGAS